MTGPGGGEEEGVFGHGRIKADLEFNPKQPWRHQKCSLMH